ncbi:MAG: hypothetical protein U9R15_10160 [Chloroflexota bacterium]|nr:hypothetical protein [Chloroflexota bacterium]
MDEWRMDECPVCKETLRDALVVCAHCGEVLPLRVVVVSEGSHGGGFALVKRVDGEDAGSKMQEEING